MNSTKLAITIGSQCLIFFLKFIQVLEILNFFGYNILHFGSKIS